MATEGQIYNDPTTGTSYIYQNGAWSQTNANPVSYEDYYQPQVKDINGTRFYRTWDPYGGEDFTGGWTNWVEIGTSPSASQNGSTLSSKTGIETDPSSGISYFVTYDSSGNIIGKEPVNASNYQASSSTAMTDYQKGQLDLAQKQYQLDAAKQAASTQADLAAIQLQQQQLDMEKEQFAANYGLSQQQMAQDEAQFAAQLGLSQQQFQYQQERDAADREQEAALRRQEYLQQLLAKGPASWLDLALYEGYNPTVQDFMTGQNQLGGSVPGLLTGENAGLKTGDFIPGWQGIPTTGTTGTSKVATVATTPYTPYIPQTYPTTTTNTQPTYTPQVPGNYQGGQNASTDTEVMKASGTTGLSTQAIQDMMTNAGVNASTAGTATLANRKVVAGSTGNAPALTDAEIAALQSTMPGSYNAYQAQSTPLATQQAFDAYVRSTGSNPYSNMTFAEGAQAAQNAGLLNPAPAPTTQPATTTSTLTADEIARQQAAQNAAAYYGYAGYANGGQPRANRPFIVGERGPELGYMNGKKLTIIPLSKIPGMANGGTYSPYIDDPLVMDRYGASNNTTETMSTANTTGSASQLQSTLPALLNPSRQYQSRMNPDQLAMFYAYEQLRTGLTPEAQAWKLSAYAPPGGYSPGLNYTRR